MSATLVLVLVVAGAYLAAHVAFEWLARRHSIVSGAEYLLLGILLGPEVAGIITVDVVSEFAPFMTLSLGWIGAVVGAQFSLSTLARIPPGSVRVAAVEAALSFTLVAAAMAAALVLATPLDLAAAAVPAVAMGAVATASAPSGIVLVRKRPGRTEPLARQLAVATAFDALLAITAFGLLLGIANPGTDLASRAPTPTEWAVISIAIGAAGGVLFHLFLGNETEIDRLFIALAGALILVSGAAAYLRLSPLFPAMLVGLILVNTSANAERVQEVLARVERPLYFVLLIFAGAAWRADGVAWLIPLLFILVRGGAKLAGGWVGAVHAGLRGELGGAWGRALLGQGGLAIAIGLNYRIVEHPQASTVFTAAILSVLLTDLSSARLARSVVLAPSRGGPSATGRRPEGGAGNGAPEAVPPAGEEG